VRATSLALDAADARERCAKRGAGVLRVGASGNSSARAAAEIAAMGNHRIDAGIYDATRGLRQSRLTIRGRRRPTARDGAQAENKGDLVIRERTQVESVEFSARRYRIKMRGIRLEGAGYGA